MQLLPGSAEVLKDSIHPDTISWSGVISYDTAHRTGSSGDTFIDIFHGHQLKPRHAAAQPLTNEGSNWLFGVLILVIAIFTYLRISYRKYISQLLKALFNVNIANQIVRDENILVQRASLMLNMIFYMSAAMLLYFISVQYDWQLKGMGTGFKRFAYLGMMLAAVYLIKLMVITLAGKIFNLGREMSAYIFNIFLINNMLGIALLPLLVLFIFSGYMQLSWLLIAGIVLVGSAYVYRIFRGILIGITSSAASFTYIFLYICALEIAPLFIAIKLISEQ
jgi:hypothetical protein